MLSQTQRNHGHRQRLRARFERNTMLFPDYELLELILGSVLLRKDTKPLAKTLLQHFGSLRGILNASEQSLLQVTGVGPGVVTFLKVLCELHCRYVESDSVNKHTISDFDTIVALAKLRIDIHEDQLWLVLVDSQLHLIAFERLNQKAVDDVHFCIREVIRIALQTNTWGFFLIRNFPDDDFVPSVEEIKFTEALSTGAGKVEVRMFDHIILTAGKAHSIRGSGLVAFDT